MMGGLTRSWGKRQGANASPSGEAECYRIAKVWGCDAGRVLDTIVGTRHNTTTDYTTRGWGEMGNTSDHVPVAVRIEVHTQAPQPQERTRRTQWQPRDQEEYWQEVRKPWLTWNTSASAQSQRRS